MEIREIAIPRPEPGAIVVKVEAATVCGTDVHIWQGDVQPEWPVGMGHEMVTNSYSLAGVNEALEAMAAMREIKPAIIPSLG